MSHDVIRLKNRTITMILKKIISNNFTQIDIDINKINDFDDALIILLFSGDQKMRKKALNLLKSEVDKNKVIWGSLAPFVAIFHYVMFERLDLELGKIFIKLFKNISNQSINLSDVDRILLEMSIMIYEYFHDLIENRDELIKLDKKYLIEVLSFKLKEIVNSFSRIETPYPDPLVNLVKYVFLAELGYNSYRDLNNAITISEEFATHLVDDDDIIQGFLIIRDEVKNYVEEYFRRRARNILNILGERSQECIRLKTEKEKLEEKRDALKNHILVKVMDKVVMFFIFAGFLYVSFFHVIYNILFSEMFYTLIDYLNVLFEQAGVSKLLSYLVMPGIPVAIVLSLLYKYHTNILGIFRARPAMKLFEYICNLYINYIERKRIENCLEISIEILKDKLNKIWSDKPKTIT